MVTHNCISCGNLQCVNIFKEVSSLIDMSPFMEEPCAVWEPKKSKEKGYRMKKDLPFAKKGEDVEIEIVVAELGTLILIRANGNTCGLPKQDFDDWVEEIKPEEWGLKIDIDVSPDYDINTINSLTLTFNGKSARYKKIN